MADMMTFPDTVEEFMEQYKITDTEQIYTNGTELVPIFRMRQWFDHKPERKKGAWINEGRIIRCNKCKIGYATVKGMKSALTYNFCPNCGAKMEVEHDISRHDKRSRPQA